jgi:hypothetical protein
MAIVFCVFAVITTIIAAQSESDPREVVQASEILEKIERGEAVNYVNKIIEGDINIDDRKLPEVRTARSYEEIYLGISENLRVVRSPLTLQDCLIKGDVDFSNARIMEPTFIYNDTILGKINFRGSQFNGSAYFSYSRFNQSADFDCSRFNQFADFSYSRFDRNAYFYGSRFDRDAYFSDSQFNQFASFFGSRFEQDANFLSSRFQSADFRDSRFNGSGFSWSQFDKDAEFSSSRFNQSAYFLSSRFNQSAYFYDSRFNQSAYFCDSQFNQSAHFSDSQFNQSANFSSTQFDKDSYFSRSYLRSVDFNRTTFSGDLSLEGSRIESLNLTHAKLGKIFLRWQSIGHMEYDETAYLMLMGNFRSLNFLEDANDCYYDYRNDRRATLPLLYQPVDYTLMLFYGYGVKPDRPVLWSLVFVAFFAALFWWRQGILPVREGEPEEEANRFSLLEAVAFSAMTFLSGGKLAFDPPEYRIAPGRPWRDVKISKALFILERLIGMVLIIMFAIAVGKTIILGGG